MQRAGGVALLLPPGPPQLAGPALDGVDALLIAGGPDVEPARYGAERVAVVRARFRWSDVGSWAAVAALWSGGNGRNALRGRAVSIDSRGCLVDSSERLVAVLGVEDLVVVDTPDAILVCHKDRAQDVRLVVDELRRRGLRRYL